MKRPLFSLIALASSSGVLVFCLERDLNLFEIIEKTHNMPLKYAEKVIRKLLKEDMFEADALYRLPPSPEPDQNKASASPVFYAAFAGIKKNNLIPFELLLAASNPDNRALQIDGAFGTLFEEVLIALEKKHGTPQQAAAEKIVNLVLKRKKELNHSYYSMMVKAFSLPEQHACTVIKSLVALGLQPDNIYPEDFDASQGRAPIAYAASFAIIKGRLKAFELLLERCDMERIVCSPPSKRRLLDVVTSFKTVTQEVADKNFIEKLFQKDDFDYERVERAQKIEALVIRRRDLLALTKAAARAGLPGDRTLLKIALNKSILPLKR